MDGTVGGYGVSEDVDSTINKESSRRSEGGRENMIQRGVRLAKMM
jgi:hypothetical protein